MGKSNGEIMGKRKAATAGGKVLGAEWGNKGEKPKGHRGGHRHKRHVSGDCAWHSRTREAQESAQRLGVGPRGKGYSQGSQGQE